MERASRQHSAGVGGGPWAARRAFSLVELLVVVGIVALLVGLFLPALTRARTAARAGACLAHQRQLGVGVFAYANDHDGGIPRGPHDVVFIPPDHTFAEVGYDVIWLPPGLFAPRGFYNAHGVLLDGYLPTPEVMICPDAPEPKTDPGDLEDLGQSGDMVAVSYMYRNLDQTSRDKVDDLGRNDAGGRAAALLWDKAMDLPAANPFNLPPQVNINHRGGVTNALYVDGHARAFAYDPDFFLFRRQDYAGPIQGLMKREDNILIRLDYAMTGDPADAPQLP